MQTQWLALLEQRLVRYAQIDSQSRPESRTVPSTTGQLNVLKLLAQELQELGALDVRMDAYGYVTATLPATANDVDTPTVAFLAHVDTAPDFSGSDVRPIVHRRYAGGPISLPDNPQVVISPGDNPDLAGKKGEDIITASGKTLLGADDKAGLAIIMTLAEYLLAHRELLHGRVRVCFTPDEEVGRGVDNLKLPDLAANVAYTVDGAELGEVVYETFSADMAIISIEGVAIHPGDAKGRMVNALRLGGRLAEALPRDECTPETTDGYQGYIHLLRVSGDPAKMEMRLLLRDFEMQGLEEKRDLVQSICDRLQAEEPRSKITCTIERQYRNMRYWLEKDMRPVDLAIEAVRRAGVEPVVKPTRGGTDGSRLTEMGLPTPNLFTGGHNMHGPMEWISVQDMGRSLQTCVELVQLWHEQGNGYQGWRP